MAVLVLAGLGVLLVRHLEVPPYPDLPYPSGQALQDVRGNCRSGSELSDCDSGDGPRTFLRVTAADPRGGSDALLAALQRDGWSPRKGLVARDFAEEGEPEDIEPVVCRKGDGCLGVFRYQTGAYVLAWWQDGQGA